MGLVLALKPGQAGRDTGSELGRANAEVITEVVWGCGPRHTQSRAQGNLGRSGRSAEAFSGRNCLKDGAEVRQRSAGGGIYEKAHTKALRSKETQPWKEA